jgi:hypothetical protein
MVCVWPTIMGAPLAIKDKLIIDARVGHDGMRDWAAGGRSFAMAKVDALPRAPFSPTTMKSRLFVIRTVIKNFTFDGPTKKASGRVRVHRLLRPDRHIVKAIAGGGGVKAGPRSGLPATQSFPSHTLTASSTAADWTVVDVFVSGLDLVASFWRG